MFEKIVSFSLANRGAVLFCTALLAVGGYFSFSDLTIEAFPDPTDTQVNIITIFDGQPAEEVERQIGLPLERALNSTPQLSRLRNTSMFGLSSITLTFNDGTDGLWARQQTLERLREADLPAGVTPSLGAYATPIGEVYRFTLEGANGDPMKLRTLNDWVVKPMLMRVNGVADVVSYGGLVREIHVAPLPAALASFNLSLDDLEKAIRGGSVNASGGVLERGSEQFVLRSEGLFHDTENLGDVRVSTHEGTPVFLRDVATISEGWAPRQGVVSRGRQYDAVQGIVLMRRGENPTVVLEGLREQIKKVNLRLVTDGAHIEPFYDRSELVGTTMETVGHNLIEGALLVMLVLFVFLLDLRAAIIVATIIPLSLAAAFVFLHSRGMSANLLSMGAVDFGVIVDGGVVIIECILVALAAHEGRFAGLSAKERIRRSTLEVVRPTVFAQLIIIAAYLPIFMLQRVEGRIFSPMANTVVSALVGAMLLSVTLAPVLASFVYARGAKHKESPVLRWAARIYEPSLKFALEWPKLAVGVATLMLAGAVIAVPHLGSEFLPELNEGALYMTFTTPANISLTEGRALVPHITELIERNKAVESVLSQLGRPEDGTDPKLTNNLEFFVRLKPATDWPQGVKTLGDVIESLNTSVLEVPGVEVNFSQPIRDNVNESISGQQGQVAVKLFGDDLTELQAKAEQVKNIILGVQGSTDVGIVKSGVVPQIQITPDRNALARYGLDIGDLQKVFQTAVGGLPVSVLWEGERRFDIVLRLPSADRDDVEKIAKLRVPIGDGTTLPLEAMAKVTTGMGRAAINRENGRRYIGVRMNIRGRDMGSFVEQARTEVAKAVADSPGIQVEWGGEFENKERAMKRLAQVVPVALILTLLLLFKAFNSFGRAVVTMMNVPFALVGGVFGLWLMNMPLSVAAAVGFIALIGQASLNGVLVTSAISARRGEGLPLNEAIMQGCRERLRPVLMTAALAALGLVPAVMSKGIGSETQKPLAVVIVFGTLSAFALTMVLLPVLYRWYAGIFEPVVSAPKPQNDEDESQHRAA